MAEQQQDSDSQGYDLAPNATVTDAHIDWKHGYANTPGLHLTVDGAVSTLQNLREMGVEIPEDGTKEWVTEGDLALGVIAGPDAREYVQKDRTARDSTHDIDGTDVVPLYSHTVGGSLRQAVPLPPPREQRRSRGRQHGSTSAEPG